MAFRRISASDIREALRESTRQYLVGALARPQTLDHINDEDIEIGISSYKKATHEATHRHQVAKEYQYVIRGMTEYMNVDTKEIYCFVAGDFYVIYPGTTYAQRVKNETDILFIKYPSGNDKVDVDEDAEVLDWMKENLRVKRIDYKDNKDAPKPNSLKPAVAVAVYDNSGNILLVKRRDSGNWTMPGGTMEINESIMECGCREVYEETGLSITIEEIVGTYTDPRTIVAYSDGEVRREFSILLSGRSEEGRIKIDEESTEIMWCPLEDALNLPMAESQRIRVRDFADYRKRKRQFIR